jgi:hypothetical protein
MIFLKNSQQIDYHMRKRRNDNSFTKTITYDVITISHGHSVVRLVFCRFQNRKWTLQRGEQITTLAKVFYGEENVKYEFDVLISPKRSPKEKTKAQIIFKQLIGDKSDE